MSLAIAQLNQTVGDLPANARRILDAAAQGRAAGASLVVTPELSLCGYPPEDLILRPAFLDACARELAALAAHVTAGVLVVGFPERYDGQRHNAMAVIRGGRVEQVYRKQCLPNYTVFDEQRYFTPGNAPCVFDVDGVRFGLVICEDIWFPAPAARAQVAGAQVLLVANGSPYHMRRDGHADRVRQSRRRSGRARVRRRFVRAGRGWHACAAVAGMARGGCDR
jgi:predicted amidohydrolase